MLFEPHFPTAFHFNWQWTKIMDSCGPKIMYGGGEISSDYMELVVFSFHYSNKKCDRGGKTSQPVLIYKTVVVIFFCEVLSWFPWTDTSNQHICVRKAIPLGMTWINTIPTLANCHPFSELLAKFLSAWQHHPSSAPNYWELERHRRDQVLLMSPVPTPLQVSRQKNMMALCKFHQISELIQLWEHLYSIITTHLNLINMEPDNTISFALFKLNQLQAYCILN